MGHEARNSAAYGADLKNAMVAQNVAGDVVYDLVACYGLGRLLRRWRSSFNLNDAHSWI